MMDRTMFDSNKFRKMSDLEKDKYLAEEAKSRRSNLLHKITNSLRTELEPFEFSGKGAWEIEETASRLLSSMLHRGIIPSYLKGELKVKCSSCKVNKGLRIVTFSQKMQEFFNSLAS